MIAHLAMLVAMLEAGHPTGQASFRNLDHPRIVLAAAKVPDSNLPYVDTLVAQAQQLLAVGPSRDPAAAAVLLEEAAGAGNIGAMLMLADLAGRGDGIPADFQKAKGLLEGAIAAGAAKDGSRSLGDLYRLADPAHRDPVKAVEAYQRAADLGDPWAMLSLALLVGHGEGAPVDFDRARTLLEGAIAGGVVKDGSRELGELYRLADAGHRDLAKAAEAYQRAADLDDIGAMLTLAEMARTGDGIEADFDRARKLLERAVAAGAVKDGARALGNLYRLADVPNRDPVKAARSYQQAIDAGDPWAMLALAPMTASGDGVPANFDKAKKLLDDAIATGAPKDGWRTLGDLYRMPGDHLDLAKAADAYQHAVDLGDPWANMALAPMVARGEGVSADFDEARTLLETAITAGLVKDGSRALGDLYRLADDAHRDPAKAVAAYKRSADLGEPGAMVSLAQMLGRGEGVPADFDQAKTLLQAAIAAGLTKDGWRELGELYRLADASHRDPAKASDAYQHAVDLGDVGAMMTLAQMASTGDGIPVDFDRAKALLEGAVKAGQAKDGSRALGDLYRLADATHRDPAKAADYYQRAVDLGDPWAMMALAPMVGSGDGMTADFPRAKKLLDDAIAAGLGKDGWRVLADLCRAPGLHQDPAKAAEAYQHAIDLGDGWSRVALAHMLGHGEGVPVDFDRARDLLEAAIAGGLSKDASLELGDLYRDAAPDHMDLGKAAEAYQQAADLGNPGAMIALASLIGHGDGLPQDFDKAKKLLETAIAAGLQKDGSNELGDLYRLTDKEHRDPAKAVEAYQRAVDLGHPGAMMTLAQMLATGDGVPVDFDRARTLLESAIAAGVVKDGSRSLGDLYRLADAAHRDPAKAAEAYQRAIDLGDPWSMMSLAPMVSAGDGVPADFVRAKTLLEGAIAAGLQKEGSRALGDLYRNADAAHRDPAKAAEAYVKAVDLGDPGAMIALATILGNGDGMAVDFNKARTLIESAIAGGLKEDGLRALGDLYRNASAVYRDPVKAAQAYEIGVSLGDPWAMMPLAQMLAKGDGVPQDFDRAESLLKTAIKKGVGKDGYHALGDLYRVADAAHSDPAKAFEAYQKAADLGDAWAMLALADMTSSGNGTKVDFAQARALAQKAIDAGLVKDGSRMLGGIYLADAAHRDPAKAAQAFQRGVDLGDPYAMMALAPMVANGDGVPANFNRARVMLETAIAAGMTKDAANILGDLYMGQPPTPKNIGRAKANYELAAQAGNTQANLRLAIILSDQFRDPATRARAIEQFRIAAKALGTDFVAKEMMRLNAKALIALTQQILADYGYKGPVNGVSGPVMSASIKDYCDARKVENCETAFVRQSLLAQLLAENGQPATLQR